MGLVVRSDDVRFGTDCVEKRAGRERLDQNTSLVRDDYWTSVFDPFASFALLPVRLGPPNDGGCRYLTLAAVRGERPLLLQKLSLAGGRIQNGVRGEKVPDLAHMKGTIRATQ